MAAKLHCDVRYAEIAIWSIFKCILKEFNLINLILFVYQRHSQVKLTFLVIARYSSAQQYSLIHNELATVYALLP